MIIKNGGIPESLNHKQVSGSGWGTAFVRPKDGEHLQAKLGFGIGG